MFFASASTHSVNEEDGNVPKGHEVETPGTTTGIVGGTFLTALWADGQTVFTGDDFDVDVLEFVSYFM